MKLQKLVTTLVLLPAAPADAASAQPGAVSPPRHDGYRPGLHVTALEVLVPSA